MYDNLKNKKIILGVTGSIAAYKSPLLVRELVKARAKVNVVLTPSATHFVSSLVLSNLSGNPVLSEMFESDNQTSGAWHIKLVHNCDAMIIAPCSATTIARIAIGLCDTALSTLAIALPRSIPLLISPAMDTSMWEHPATQKNVQILKDFGVIIIPPDEGELSSGLTGPGRMPEIAVLMEYLVNTFAERMNIETESNQSKQIVPNLPFYQKIKEENEHNAEFELAELKSNERFLAETGTFLKRKKILITAGPTYEKVDDVRFIGNYSSGKMGFALAEEANRAGAVVTLISGPVNLEQSKDIKRINVESASEMYNAVLKEFASCNIAILSAAVSDYTPSDKYPGKIKKLEAGDNINLSLKSTDDILLNLGNSKKPGQKLIGFALESANEISNGWKKLKTKNCNMIVVNSANKPRSGFKGDENTITILLRNGQQFSYVPMSKNRCAQEILKKIRDI